MQILQNYYYKIIKQDLLTKYTFTNYLEIPQFEKVVLRFNVNQVSLKSLLPSLAGLLLISSQKPSIKYANKANIVLRVKGGSVISCKVDLRSKDMFFFMEKLIFFVLPKMKGFSYVIQQQVLSFKIENIFLFKELEKEYEHFQDLPSLNVNVFFKAKNYSEIIGLLSAIKFPIK